MSTPTAPPLFLVDRVTPINDCPDDERLMAFLASGERSLGELERALESVGRPLGQFGAALDWGCGPGRVTLRLIDKYPNLQMTGIDTDTGSIEWLTSAAPQATFLAIQPNPPTPLGESSFDLVINHSVLTHIDYDSQKAWLSEIARVLHPDDIFVTSVHGVHALINSLSTLDNGFADTNPWLAQWRANRFVFESEDTWTGAGHHEGYHTTFQDPAGLEAISDYEFEMLATFTRADLGFQDLIVLRRRTAEEAARRRSIEPGDDGYVAVSAAAIDDDSRLARLERMSMLATISLGHLGRQVARLEEAILAAKSESTTAPALVHATSTRRGRVRALASRAKRALKRITKRRD